MDTDSSPSNSGYLLLFRGKDWDYALSDDELEQVMRRFTDWSEGLAKSGKVRGGQALGRSGKVISGAYGHSITDGPFAESKEEVGGYLLLQVETLEEAVAIAKTSPGLDFGGTIEVRPVLSECPSFKRARERLAAISANRPLQNDGLVTF